jgi:hypothetical protein
MDSKIGKMLVDANLVTESQLQEALALQREAGGRLGDNLVKLNYLHHGAFEQFIETAPPPPSPWPRPAWVRNFWSISR